MSKPAVMVNNGNGSPMEKQLAHNHNFQGLNRTYGFTGRKKRGKLIFNLNPNKVHIHIIQN
jgi:hypothetical protein